ncbi:hypothetical protein GRAN_4461 [Granulicella sibirica]|uniref:Uncharacterized protein n=1 Tax=Granulicella sibirica TaxID=2479048 RepID=A0A4Q0SX13_9BACT|nr:hypothetical protein GRAN_4461 [Granulicella sibirica]
MPGKDKTGDHADPNQNLFDSRIQGVSSVCSGLLLRCYT